MIHLMKYTYMLEPEKIKEELDKLWERYQQILENDSSFEELNEARAILFLLGNIYCEKIAVEAIEKRLHLLKNPLTIVEFLNLIDKKSSDLDELRKDILFVKLENFYLIIKEFKNKYHEGKFYLNEEKFLKEYNEKNPEKDLRMGYKGKFGDKDLNFMK